MYFWLCFLDCVYDEYGVISQKLMHKSVSSPNLLSFKNMYLSINPIPALIGFLVTDIFAKL
jgi:hypothetical protein